MQQPMEPEFDKNDSDRNKNRDNRPDIAEWRYGPAQYWYDMMNVPESGEGFDYGFKLKKQVKIVGVEFCECE